MRGRGESAQRAVHEALRQRHREALLRGAVRVCDPAGLPCTGYNVQVLPPPAAVQALLDVQQALAVEAEDGLWAIPAAALHLSVFNIVGATADHGEYACDKEQLWREIGPACVRGLRTLGRRVAPYTVQLDELAATDAAVVALGADGGHTAALREAIRTGCPIPAGTRYTPEIVHVTLFRYRGPLADPAALLERLAATRITVRVPVERLVLANERVYPALVCERVAEVPLEGSAASRPVREEQP